MPSGMEEVILAFELSFGSQSAGSITKDMIKAALLDESALSLLSKYEGLAEKQAVLFDTDPGKLGENEAVFSPILKTLERLYVGDDQDPLPLATGRTYVVYAPPNQGTSHSARAFLEEYLPRLQGQDSEKIPATQGIMITGTPGANYLSYMAERLGAKSCKTWIFALIAALCPDPRAANRQPSVLILDGLDAWNDINEMFVKKIFMALKNKGFYTVILTQNKKWASHLLSAMNNGAKILSHPSASSGGTPGEPVRNDLVWTKELLSKMITMRYPKNAPGWTGNDGLIRWIEDSWTPQDCIYHADRLLQNPPSTLRARGPSRHKDSLHWAAS